MKSGIAATSRYKRTIMRPEGIESVSFILRYSIVQIENESILSYFVAAFLIKTKDGTCMFILELWQNTVQSH